jgi:basic amino acid/polyamine antiporter, APA family
VAAEQDRVGKSVAAEPGLVHALGHWDIALLTIGAVIGSGIFLVPGQVAMATQLKPWLAATMWILGAILSLCGAITYAELARAHPEAGGLYIFIREGHGRTAAFVFGWMSLLVNISGTVATLVAAAGAIVHEAFLRVIPANWIAVGLAIALGLINLLPTRRSGDLQGWTASIKYGGVLIFASLLLIRAITRPSALPQQAVHSAPHTALVIALVSVLWTFEGWQYVTCAAGETKDAKRSIARGLVMGVCALAVLFLATSLAITLWLTESELATSSNVVDTALRDAGFPFLGVIVTVILPISILSSAHATLFTGSRVVFAMARDNLLPRALAKLSDKSGIPALAVLACTIIAAILAAMGTFDTLLAYVIVTSWLFYGLAGAAIFRDRAILRLSASTRIAAALFCMGAAGVMLFGFFSGPVSARYGLAIVAIIWVLGVGWFRVRDTEPVI